MVCYSAVLYTSHPPLAHGSSPCPPPPPRARCDVCHSHRRRVKRGTEESAVAKEPCCHAGGREPCRLLPTAAVGKPRSLHEGAEIDYALVQRRVEGWVQFVSHSVHTRSELRIAVAETLFGNGMDGSSKFLDDR